MNIRNTNLDEDFTEQYSVDMDLQSDENIDENVDANLAYAISDANLCPCGNELTMVFVTCDMCAAKICPACTISASPFCQDNPEGFELTLCCICKNEQLAMIIKVDKENECHVVTCQKQGTSLRTRCLVCGVEIFACHKHAALFSCRGFNAEKLRKPDCSSFYCLNHRKDQICEFHRKVTCGFCFNHIGKKGQRKSKMCIECKKIACSYCIRNNFQDDSLICTNHLRFCGKEIPARWAITIHGEVVKPFSLTCRTAYYILSSKPCPFPGCIDAGCPNCNKCSISMKINGSRKHETIVVCDGHLRKCGKCSKNIALHHARPINLSNGIRIEFCIECYALLQYRLDVFLIHARRNNLSFPKDLKELILWHFIKN